MYTVAFQGEHGAFSEQALFRYFGGDATPLPRRRFADVRRAVIRGEADFGILPLENSIAGRVPGSREVLAYGGVRGIGEVTLPIRLALLALPGARLEELDRAASHPVALAQCTLFLRRHPHLWPVAHYDTAGAARDLKLRGDRTLGAIAPAAAAERYGLSVLRTDVHDRADNRTRFAILARGMEMRRPCTGVLPAIGAVHQPGLS
jgi:prephenate dehydratase